MQIRSERVNRGVGDNRVHARMQRRKRAYYLRLLRKDGRDDDAWVGARCGERGSLSRLGRECGGGVLRPREPR